MKRRKDRWNFLFIAGMWFQDLFNYDFRRTEQCIIPYATQEGEISFCAYNTGVGWRNIIEKMHMTATLTKWYEEHGRHEIFAGGKKVKMEDTTHSLLLRDDIVTNELQHDLDKLGIAKTAREEKLRARDAKAAAQASAQSSAQAAAASMPQHRGPVKNDEAYNARMASLYREVVLKEKPAQSQEGFIPLGALAKPNGNGNGNGAQAPKPEVAEPVAGD
jgi:tetraether lipid synthase